MDESHDPTGPTALAKLVKLTAQQIFFFLENQMNSI